METLKPVLAFSEFNTSHLKYLYDSRSQFSTVIHVRSSSLKFHDGLNGTQADSHELVSMAGKAIFKLNLYSDLRGLLTISGSYLLKEPSVKFIV